jgi:hypothetical protein
MTPAREQPGGVVGMALDHLRECRAATAAKPTSCFHEHAEHHEGNRWHCSDCGEPFTGDYPEDYER